MQRRITEFQVHCVLRSQKPEVQTYWFAQLPPVHLQSSFVTHSVLHAVIEPSCTQNPSICDPHMVLEAGAVAGEHAERKFESASHVVERSVQAIALTPSTLVTIIALAEGRALAKQSPAGAPSPAASTRHAQKFPTAIEWYVIGTQS